VLTEFLEGKEEAERDMFQGRESADIPAGGAWSPSSIMMTPIGSETFDQLKGKGEVIQGSGSGRRGKAPRKGKRPALLSGGKRVLQEKRWLVRERRPGGKTSEEEIRSGVGGAYPAVGGFPASVRQENVFLLGLEKRLWR